MNVRSFLLVKQKKTGPRDAHVILPGRSPTTFPGRSHGLMFAADIRCAETDWDLLIQEAPVKQPSLHHLNRLPGFPMMKLRNIST